MAKPTNLRALRDHEVAQSDAECFVSLVDDLRQLKTEFGLRAYRVFLVWVEWSRVDPYEDDDEPGAGTPNLLEEIELLPVPDVSSLGGLGEDYDASGLTERGGVTVSEISASYSEDVLRGLHPNFIDPEHPGTLRDGVEFWYEIQEMRPAGYRAPQGTAGGCIPSPQRPPRRRFHLSGVPNRDPGRYQWSMTLVRADGERTRDGELDRG